MVLKNRDWRKYYKAKEDDMKYRIAEEVLKAERTDLVTFPPKKRDALKVINDSIDPMDCVEVTITFKQGLINAPDISLRSIVHDGLDAMFERGTAILYHEYGKNGRFHYHGILGSMSKKTLSTIRKQFDLKVGRIEIKTITYWESYLNYMTKELSDEDHEDELDILIFK